MSEFQKTETQREAIRRIVRSPASNWMIYGSSRSGKSFCIAYIILIRACKVKSDHIVVRSTFNSAKTSLFQKTFPDVLRLCFPDLEVKYDKTNSVIILPNESTIRVAGLDDQHKVERLLGLEVSTLWFNEANQIPFTGISKLRTRLAQKNKLKKMSFYDQNPTTKTSALYQVFELKIDPDDMEAMDKETAKDYESFQMNVQGNLHNIDEQYIKMLEKLPERERQRFLLGEYSDESDGQIYYEFKRDVHVAPVKRVPGTLFIATDFNITPHCSIGFQFIDGGIRIFSEFFLMNSDTPRAISEWESKGFGGCTVIPDSTGKARKSNSGRSDFDAIRDAGMDIMSSHNPFVKDRVNNVNRCFKEGSITIDPSCKKLINDLERTCWKNNKIDSGPEGLLGHISDALGYACHKLLPFSNIRVKPHMGRR